MKIALLSTPWIAVPPTGYGGTELVVANLAEGLVKRGHEVTLFATGDSHTSARLLYYYKKALGNNALLKKNPFYFLFHTHAFIEEIRKGKYDIVHNHFGQTPMFLLDLLGVPLVHTLHGAYYHSLQAPSGYVEEKRDTQHLFKDHAFISISDHQRTAQPELNYVKTVYNGIHAESFSPGNGSGKYLAWLGRLTPNKGLDSAINVAKKAGVHLKISAFIDESDKSYFEEKIKPLLDNKIEFIGEIHSRKEKNEFFGQAMAMLFPIRWHEPFGLVMIESMASGTPVIAFNKGSVPEVIEEGKTGLIVNTEEEMVAAISKLSSINRQYCHEYAIKRFNVEKMIHDYLEAYELVIKNHR